MSTEWGLPDRAIMTADDIADGAMISGSKVRAALRHKRLRGFRVGKHWRIKREDAISWLETGAESTPLANTGCNASETDGQPSGTSPADVVDIGSLPKPRRKQDSFLIGMLGHKS